MKALFFSMLLLCTIFSYSYGTAISTYDLNVQLEMCDGAQNASTVLGIDDPVLPSCLNQRLGQELNAQNFTVVYEQMTSTNKYAFKYTISSTVEGYAVFDTLSCSSDFIIVDDIDGI